MDFQEVLELKHVVTEKYYRNSQKWHEKLKYGGIL